MILKLLLLPFRLNWAIYFIFAFGAGYLANQEYETYLSNIVAAELQVADGPPDPSPLSKWDGYTDVSANDEVNVEGVYFPALDQGSFDPLGFERGFILLADDQGREIKAVLVVQPDDIGLLERQLAAQGTGERIPVVVNGMLNQSSEWAGLIWTELFVMDIPSSDDLVVIEPYLGNRAAVIFSAAEKTFGVVVIFGGFAAGLVLLALLNFRTRGNSSATQSQMSGRGALAARQKKQPSQRSLPSNGAPETSPWGTSDGQAGTTPPPAPANARVQSQANVRAKSQQNSASPHLKIAELEVQPLFTSVFPGGGSSFRFKSADEIIRQSFGTLSTLKPLKRDD
jgi:hypothetical protein